jgi:hypothetical protein
MCLSYDSYNGGVLLILSLAWLLAAPFWEEKPAAEWTEQQLIDLLSNSPWAQTAADAGRANRLPVPPVVIYLATATPMRQAEDELVRRRFKQRPDVFAAINDAREEYKAYLAEQGAKVIVVAIPLDPQALADAEETKRMESESILRYGKKKVKATGHFPPTPSDPVLRLIFPREVPDGAKEMSVEVYLPSVPGPYRSAQFKVKDLTYRGTPDL